MKINGISQSNSKDQFFIELERYPIAVSVNAANWQLYNNGIYTNEKCMAKSQLRHYVTAVGYNIPEGYIILKNSWGKYWGE